MGSASSSVDWDGSECGLGVLDLRFGAVARVLMGVLACRSIDVEELACTLLAYFVPEPAAAASLA